MAFISVKGNATRDAGFKTIPSGQRIGEFSLAENHFRKQHDQWEQVGATFYDVTLWGALADRAVPHVAKGQALLVSGQLSTDTYTSKDGQERIRLRIKADHIGLIPRGPENVYANAQAPDPFPEQQAYAQPRSTEPVSSGMRATSFGGWDTDAPF